MNLSEFAEAAKVKIVIGKGGVGKTTITAALARSFAGAGLNVLCVELEGRPELARAFNTSQPLSYAPTLLYSDPSSGSVSARRLTPDDALVEYLSEHGLGRLSRRLVSTGVLDIVAGSIPGLRDVLVLGKVKQLSNDPAIDVLLVDAPATGHAMTLLTSASGMMNVARSGLVRNQAEEVVSMLSDTTRCQVLLVTLPEELPVSETIEAAFLVEDRASVALGPVICNLVERSAAGLDESAAEAFKESGLHGSKQLIRALDDAATFQRSRSEESVEQLIRLRRELPLSVLELPQLACGSIALDECTVLAGILSSEIATLDGDLL
jgi:anion-transporting  ArsA/GET3 family ATPase